MGTLTQHWAYSQVVKAIRSGRLNPLAKMMCVDCGLTAHIYDHRDYAKPIAVEPLCHSCNAIRGRGLNHDFKDAELELSQRPKRPVSQATRLMLLVAGLNQRRKDWPQLARQSQLSRSWIAKFAAGQIRNPGVQTLAAIELALREVSTN